MLRWNQYRAAVDAAPTNVGRTQQAHVVHGKRCGHREVTCRLVSHIGAGMRQPATRAGEPFASESWDDATVSCDDVLCKSVSRKANGTSRLRRITLPHSVA